MRQACIHTSKIVWNILHAIANAFWLKFWLRCTNSNSSIHQYFIFPFFLWADDEEEAQGWEGAQRRGWSWMVKECGSGEIKPKTRFNEQEIWNDPWPLLARQYPVFWLPRYAFLVSSWQDQPVSTRDHAHTPIWWFSGWLSLYVALVLYRMFSGSYHILMHDDSYFLYGNLQWLLNLSTFNQRGIVFYKIFCDISVGTETGLPRDLSFQCPLKLFFIIVYFFLEFRIGSMNDCFMYGCCLHLQNIRFFCLFFKYTNYEFNFLLASLPILLMSKL